MVLTIVIDKNHWGIDGVLHGALLHNNAAAVLRIAATELALVRTEENERNPPRKVIAHYNISKPTRLAAMPPWLVST